MTNILRVLGASTQDYEVSLLERHGRRLRLQCSVSIPPGTPTRLMLVGESVLGEVIASEARNGCFEIAMTMKAREVLSGSWRPEWIGLDSQESVMGSLLAMNAHVTLHEEQLRAREAVHHDSKKSG